MASSKYDEKCIALDKYVKFVEHNSHLNVESHDPIYEENIKNMDNAERFFLDAGKKLSLKFFKDGMDPLTQRFNEIRDRYEAEIIEIDPNFEMALNSNLSRKELERIRAKSDIIMQRFYTEMGNLMDEYGILDALMHRSNAAFTKVQAPFLQCNKEMILAEFKKPIADPMPIMSAKITFYINKIVKYLDSVEFGDLLEDDKLKFKGKSDGRLKFLSKLKTDYARKLMELMMCYDSLEEQTAVLHSRTPEYERLFGEYFEDLDLEADVLKVHAYEYRKQKFYESKVEMAKNIVCTLCVSEELRTRELRRYKGLKDWGICRDADGKLVLGMSLAKYPMPITVHIPQSSFNDIFNDAHSIIKVGMMPCSLCVPEYHSLTGPKGVFPTNVLFEATEIQKQKLEKAYEKNPNNPYLRFFYLRLFPQKDKTPVKPEYKPFSEFMR